MYGAAGAFAPPIELVIENPELLVLALEAERKKKYQWGAYGLLAGGALAWVVGWTFAGKK